jgi:putative endonuclease
MYYTYILFSEKDQRLYTGYTPDLRRRIEKHQNGFVRATKFRRPLKLIYYESYLSKIDAKKREIYLKGGKGKSELKIQLFDSYKQINYRQRF